MGDQVVVCFLFMIFVFFSGGLAMKQKSDNMPCNGFVLSNVLSGLKFLLLVVDGSCDAYAKHLRYLIVVDDVREKSDWDIIKKAFPDDSPGSRIMVTTQLRSVAQLCSSYFIDEKCSAYDVGRPTSVRRGIAAVDGSLVYSGRRRFAARDGHDEPDVVRVLRLFIGGLLFVVKPLSQLDSEMLFFKNDFAWKNPKHVSDEIDEILRRCGGIPLFISGTSDCLREEAQETGGFVSPSRKKNISTSYGRKIISKVPRHIEQSLATIYDDLPYTSKVLLMYMGIFAEGQIFYKDSLCRKWIIEGLIDLAEADTYFSEFIDRNIITRVAATNEQYPSQEENCQWQVNYFTQQFLASKSSDKGLFSTNDTLTTLVARGGKRLGRWLSLHQPDAELPTLLEEMDLSHTRSLAISGQVEGIPLNKFTHLVVLDLEGWQRLQDEDMVRICKMSLLQHLSLRNTTGVTKLPPEIKELQLLQWLDISHTSICELPSQVCELDFLRILDLRSTPIRQLPEQFWKLELLRTLLVGSDGVNRYETSIEIPEGIRRIPYLDTLETVDLSGCSVSLMEALGGIKELQVTWYLHQCSDKRFQQALRSAIKNFKVLESLTIHCGIGCCMDFLDSMDGLYDSRFKKFKFKKFKVANGRFSKLPQWFTELSNLTSIEITVCRLEPEDLSILRNLPKLEYLVLGLHFIPEAAIVIDWMGFDQLKRLSVSCRVPWLTFHEGAMEELTFLELKIAGSPASQESVPSGISNLQCLSEVAIRYHSNYTNSPNVKRTIEAVRRGVDEHRMPINLFINGIEDEEEDVEAFEVERTSAIQNEIQAEE